MSGFYRFCDLFCLFFKNLSCSYKDADFCKEFPDKCVRTAAPIPTEMQPNLYAPTAPHRNAKSFENVYIRKGYASAVRRFGPDSRSYKLEKLIKKIKRHI